MRTRTIVVIFCLLLIAAGVLFFGKSTQAPSMTPEENSPEPTGEVPAMNDDAPVTVGTEVPVEERIPPPPNAPIPNPEPTATITNDAMFESSTSDGPVMDGTLMLN